MAKKTDQERLQELELKIKQMKVRKQQVESRIKEKERKQRTRRLIQVGAIFQSYFGFDEKKNDPLTPERAEQIALFLSTYVREHKDKLKLIDIEKSKENRKIVYKEPGEKITIPNENKENPYKA